MEMEILQTNPEEDLLSGRVSKDYVELMPVQMDFVSIKRIKIYFQLLETRWSSLKLQLSGGESL